MISMFDKIARNLHETEEFCMCLNVPYYRLFLSIIICEYLIFAQYKSCIRSAAQRQLQG